MQQTRLADPHLGEDEEAIDDVDAGQEVIPLRHDITAYGADFTVDSLVNRLERHDIIIPSFDPSMPTSRSGVVGFQRNAVWTQTQKDRFIESLLLGFPVPGIFLVAEPDGTYLVLDGQQRLLAIWDYCQERGNNPALDKVVEDYRGLTYGMLPNQSRRVLDNSLIHATIVQESTPSKEKDSVYQIFERLNTGGTQLTPQEIRIALYRGDMMEMVRTLNSNEAWRIMYGKVNRRLKDQELILRSLAMYEKGDDYKRPMKKFLNDFASDNRTMEREYSEGLKSVFERTIDQIVKGIGKKAFRPYTTGRLNAAVLESLFVGVACRLDSGPITDSDRFESAFEKLISNTEYRSAVESSTADEPNVATRLRLSRQAFADVE